MAKVSNASGQEEDNRRAHQGRTSRYRCDPDPDGVFSGAAIRWAEGNNGKQFPTPDDED